MPGKTVAEDHASKLSRCVNVCDHAGVFGQEDDDDDGDDHDDGDDGDDDGDADDDDDKGDVG